MREDTSVSEVWIVGFFSCEIEYASDHILRILWSSQKQLHNGCQQL